MPTLQETLKEIAEDVKNHPEGITQNRLIALHQDKLKQYDATAMTIRSILSNYMKYKVRHGELSTTPSRGVMIYTPINQTKIDNATKIIKNKTDLSKQEHAKKIALSVKNFDTPVTTELLLSQNPDFITKCEHKNEALELIGKQIDLLIIDGIIESKLDNSGILYFMWKKTAAEKLTPPNINKHGIKHQTYEDEPLPVKTYPLSAIIDPEPEPEHEQPIKTTEQTAFDILESKVSELTKHEILAEVADLTDQLNSALNQLYPKIQKTLNQKPKIGVIDKDNLKTIYDMLIKIRPDLAETVNHVINIHN